MVNKDKIKFTSNFLIKNVSNEWKDEAFFVITIISKTFIKRYSLQNGNYKIITYTA